MAVSAPIGFIQGAFTSTPGVAMIGVVGSPVTVYTATNPDNQKFTYALVSVPPLSALLPSIYGNGSLAQVQFTPDVAGGYLWDLVTTDQFGNTAHDQRVFQVPEASGRIIPPAAARDDALNFIIGGVMNKAGWAPFLNAYLRTLDTFALPLESIGHRLTLTTAVPVTTADVTGATVIYLTPYKSQRIALYTSSVWTMYNVAEISKALGTLTSGKNYDVFAYDSGGGVVALEFSVAWTSDTARSDAIAQQDGVWVKSSDHSRRYLGTFRTTSTTQTADSGGTAGTGNGGQRFVFNLYNQVRRFLKVTDSTSSWTYSVSATFRAARAQAGNCFEILQADPGMVGGFLEATVKGAVVSSIATALDASVGVGVDSTSVNSAIMMGIGAPPAATGTVSIQAFYRGYVGLGYHKITWLETGGNGTNVTFQGAPAAQYAHGMVGEVMA